MQELLHRDKTSGKFDIISAQTVGIVSLRDCTSEGRCVVTFLLSQGDLMMMKLGRTVQHSNQKGVSSYRERRFPYQNTYDKFIGKFI